jgi:hypothetical protein
MLPSPLQIAPGAEDVQKWQIWSFKDRLLTVIGSDPQGG